MGKHNLVFLFILSLLVFNIFCPPESLAQKADPKPNVLFISVDDMNNWISILENYPGVKTPNIERLAKQGVFFKEAHTASPICNPSRFAALSGLLPSKTSVYDRKSIVEPLVREKQFKFIMDYFKEASYHVEGSGKVFHTGSNIHYDWNKYERYKKKKHRKHLNGITDFTGSFFDWGVYEGDELDIIDVKLANAAASFLTKKHRKPFFLAVGIHNPHLPWIVPQRFFDLYPIEDISLNFVENDLRDLPPAARDFINFEDDAVMPSSQARKEATQAYLAMLTFTDELVGKIIDSLEASAYLDNTIVVFWSDHGLHLGEKQHWRKSTLWREATHVPLIFVTPETRKAGGQVISKPVGFVDILPTTLDLCGLEADENLDGRSLQPLFNGDREWNYPAITIMNPYNSSVHYKNWHYIQYKNYDEELYDYIEDPNDLRNLANEQTYKDVLTELRELTPQTYFISLQELAVYALSSAERKTAKLRDCSFRAFFSYLKLSPAYACDITASDSIFTRYRN